MDAAKPGDTITICPGAYAEGSGNVGTNALTINKSLTIKGAGADLVRITPKSSGPASGQIMELYPDLRNGIGDIVAITGAPSQPLTVDISGVTVDGWDPQGHPVAVEAGVLFLDAKGSVNRSRVTNIVTSEGNEAWTRAGGYRGTQPGIGIAQVTAALYAPVDGSRRLEINRTRVDKYNKVGVLIDGAINDAPPLTTSGTVDWGVITASQIIGRTLCINYRGTGNCAQNNQGPGGNPLTTGPLFGQDGLRVTAGSYATVESSLISQNFVLGTGAPVKGSATNNANLSLGSGVRYVGAKMNDYSDATSRVNYSHIFTSNIMDNAYGAINVGLDGTTPATGNPNASATSTLGNLLVAPNNWWGLNDIATTNNGPAISPTTNPPAGENPVNGTAVTKTSTGAQTSNSVDFSPYRNGSQGNQSTGQYPVLTAPIPVSDAPPTIALSAPATASPGQTITLTATPGDDFGVKRVRFASGATTLGIATVAPYTQSYTLASDAACGSTRTLAAVASDSANQTASSTATITVTCPTPAPAPAKPTLAWASAPATLKGSGDVTLTPTAAAGLKSIVVFLGNRQVCSITAAPYGCKVSATGADVGTQTLRAVITDQLGSTAEVTRSIRVAKFKSKLSLSVARKTVKGGVKRTIRGKLSFPSAVTKGQGCSGNVQLTVKRAGRSLLNQEVKVSKSCTFSRSITAGKSNQKFEASAKYGGNAALATAKATRRFS